MPRYILVMLMDEWVQYLISVTSLDVRRAWAWPRHEFIREPLLASEWCSSGVDKKKPWMGVRLV